MFSEVRDMLPISGEDYDAQIIREIKACVIDLTSSAEIVLPGEVIISRTQGQGGVWTITDSSTLTDEFVITVISIWCNMRIGNPPNYQELLRAYNSYKGQMRTSKKYTTYGGGGEDEDADQH